MSETQGETVPDARLTWYIAIGNLRSWGRAKTEKQAIANMHREGRSWLTGNVKADEYVVYHVGENAYVNDMGCVAWPTATDPEPVKIKHIKPKK